MPPKVAVIVLNWNGLQDTLRCLKALQRTTYPNYEVVVVDNGSDGDDTAALRERSGNYIHLIENDRNYGYAEGSNIGARYALQKIDPEYIALLDNDTVVDPEWLTELVEPFLRSGGSSLGATCSLIRYLSRADGIQYGGDGRMNIFGQTRGSSKVETSTRVRTLAGPSCLISKRALESLGELFCPEFFIYYNDIDLSWRLDSLGYELRYVPTSVVFHKESASARNAAIRQRNAVLKTRNKYLIFYRNLSLGKFMAVFPLLFLYDVIIALGATFYKRNRSIPVTRMMGIIEFLRTLSKVPRVGGGRLGYLDKRLYLDKLG
jgi:GT2 family glycosyltransferase